MVDRTTPVPQHAWSRAQGAYQSQGQPTQNKVIPTNAQTAMAATARRGGSRRNAQAERMGNRNQAWILVRSASDQSAPATAIARSSRGDRIARSPATSASVQNKL